MSGGVVLSARAAQRAFLEPTMEAIAVGLQEDVVIVDELVPLLPSVLREISPGERAGLLHCYGDLRRLNIVQVDLERQVAGAVDGLVIDLHSLELSGGGVDDLGVRAVAARVRGPLGVLADESSDVLEIADAVRAIDETLVGAPRAQIFGASLENLLGGRKYRLLVALDGRRRERLGLAC